MNAATSALPVLIVEDDAPTRRLLQAVLGHAGFASVFAANGAEAIGLVRTNDYAAIVLDIMMPEVGGHEVIQLLAAESISIPVVVCSAAGPRVLTGFDTNVVKAVVRKPFDVEELVAIITKVARPNS